ncbi:hypothetical protein EV361DRAFT_148361 [Lentinula raphanica]|nr:hypothetical protein EV361DRAFT_148361 [Lentinula raphanica]
MKGQRPLQAEYLGSASATTARDTASKDLFGGAGVRKGSSPGKYGTKKKAALDSTPSRSTLYRSRNLEAIQIETPDASIGTSSRKRPLTPSDDDSDIEIISPLTPLTPTTRPKPNLSKARDGEHWSIENLGDFVWVHVNRAGQVFDAKDDPEDGDVYMWWPAKVLSLGLAKGEITVRLYGTFPASSTTIICINNPSVNNIRSLADSFGRPRFDSPSASRRITSVHESPKKKQKHDLSTANADWQAAVCEILRDKEDEDDGLPPIEFALSAASRFASASASQSTVPSPKKIAKMPGKPKTKSFSDDNGEFGESGALVGNDSDWDPSEADDMLDIPGELVLARDRPDKKVAHWPAKLLAYIPPAKAHGKARRKEPRYRILFLDDTQQDVPRSWFYACYEREFGTCEMGKFLSGHVDNPEDSAEDSKHVTKSSTTTFPSRGRDPNRSPSRSPIPLSSLSGAFNDLSIHSQLSYLKPVLRAILDDNYAPAKERHDKFMKGGQARAGLGASAGLRGTIPPSDVDALQHHLSDWCFRNEARSFDPAGHAVSSHTFHKQDARRPLKNTENTDATSDPMPVRPSFLNACSPTEDIQRDGEGVGMTSMKDSISESRNSPALTDEDSRASPPAFPPTSSTVSLLSEDDVQASRTDSLTTKTTDVSVIPKRQKGCSSYENLTELQKINYCLNVLLPEAVLQLLLWRNGHRTSIELLSDVEEAQLHEKAEKLAQETDWVFDVVRLREMKARQAKKQAATVVTAKGQDNTPTRTSSRGRRLPARYQN